MKVGATLLAAIALAASAASQDLSAKSAIAIDAESGKVLYAKDAETPRFPASTTKIMTALLLIERRPPEAIITAPADIENVKEASMHLKPGERVSAHDMLYALMLRSANDGCVAVADDIAGSVPAFAEMMNERAKALGCTNTHFHNPNGLNDDDHTVSAHDLALIAREAMTHPEFREAVRTKKYKIQRSIDQADLWMVSRNKRLWNDPTADGIKTGYTVPAGHCYVGSATRNGFRVITVVFKSDHWQDDHAALLDRAFASYERKQVLSAEQPLGQISVKNGVKPLAEYGLNASILQTVRKGDTPQVIQHFNEMRAPVRKGDEVGTLEIVDSEGFKRTEKLYALEDVKESPAPIAALTAGNGRFLFFFGAMVAGFVMLRRKSRRMKLYAKSPAISRF